LFIPAIALTGYATMKDRERALSAGYQLHLAKPVEPEDLVAAIVNLVCPSD
jgi:CheY-like chemotaxis protein